MAVEDQGINRFPWAYQAGAPPAGSGFPPTAATILDKVLSTGRGLRRCPSLDRSIGSQFLPWMNADTIMWSTNQSWNDLRDPGYSFSAATRWDHATSSSVAYALPFSRLRNPSNYPYFNCMGTSYATYSPTVKGFQAYAGYPVNIGGSYTWHLGVGFWHGPTSNLIIGGQADPDGGDQLCYNSATNFSFFDGHATSVQLSTVMTGISQHSGRYFTEDFFFSR